MPADPATIAEAIRRYTVGPHVEGLMGCAQHTPAAEVIPAPGEPCGRCGAVRDERGKIRDVEVRDPLTGEHLGTVLTGIRAGDALACTACTCLEPALERLAPHTGYPVEDPAAPQRPKPTRLSARDRRSLVRRGPVERAWLAMKDAEHAGDAITAGRLQTLIYRHRDGLIGDAELDRLAGEVTSVAAA